VKSDYFYILEYIIDPNPELQEDLGGRPLTMPEIMLKIENFLSEKDLFSGKFKVC